jgi:hypothetical protein
MKYQNIFTESAVLGASACVVPKQLTVEKVVLGNVTQERDSRHRQGAAVWGCVLGRHIRAHITHQRHAAIVTGSKRAPVAARVVQRAITWYMRFPGVLVVLGRHI